MHAAKRRYTVLIVIGPLRPRLREILSRAPANIDRQTRFFGQRIFRADGLNRLHLGERSIQPILGKPNCQHYLPRSAAWAPGPVLIVTADSFGQRVASAEEID